MATTTTPAKTPTVAIARVLRGLGLVQGADFKVTGEYRGRGLDRERVGTYVLVLTRDAEQTIADNADAIEAAALAQGGFAFRVSIYRTPSGGFWTRVANYGPRTREGHVLDTDADRERMGLTAPEATEGDKQCSCDCTWECDRPADEPCTCPCTCGAQTAPEAAEQPATVPTAAPVSTEAQIAAQDPYAGLAVKRYGALYWACQEAGQVWFFQDGYHAARYTLRVYNGRAMLRGWYLTGPGLPAEGRHMGKRLSVAAEESESVIMAFKVISDTMERTAREWPTGTLVSNGHRTGRVNGAGWGVVTLEGHENYGRAWVDVDWDAVEGDMGSNRRGRPFADTLLRAVA
ncbi:hypothetical protein SEA_MISCHIEF19_75 [Streptomyces phage Mischief19]|nr:hypothetical protein SEA_MISCHIEF19_75 [Streptomyces phage Mischief19]